MPQFPEQNVNNALILPAGLDGTSAAGARMSHATQQSPKPSLPPLLPSRLARRFLMKALLLGKTSNSSYPT